MILNDVEILYDKEAERIYDKGFKDGNSRDLSGSLIEVLNAKKKQNEVN